MDGIIVLGGEVGERINILAEFTRDFPQARLVYSGPGEDRAAEALLKTVSAASASLSSLYKIFEAFGACRGPSL